MTDFVRSRGFIAILILAVCLRLAAAFYLGNTVSGFSGAFDEISYDLLGHRWAEGFGLTFPQDWYPWVPANAPQSYYSASLTISLGLLYTTIGYVPLAARLIMAVLSTMIVGALMVLTRRLFDERVALIAGVIAACYAYLIFYGVTLLTETPFALLLLLALILAYQIRDSPTRGKLVLFGLILGGAMLMRMAVIAFVPILILWTARGQVQMRSTILIPVILITLAIVPFTFRNHQLWGRFLLLESQFGHVFWNGNHPEHHGNFDPAKVFPIPADVLASHNEAEMTNRLLLLGLSNVVNDPKNFILLTLTRLRELFKFWPTSDSTALANLLRIVSFAWLMPLAGAGLVLNRLRWREHLPVLLFLLIHITTYAITWSMIRYRIPVDLLLIAYAAYIIYSASGWWLATRKVELTRTQIEQKA